MIGGTAAAAVAAVACCCARDTGGTSSQMLSRTSTHTAPLLAIALQEKLRSTSGPAAVEEVAALLAELGSQLGEVLPARSSEAAEVAERLDRHLLLQQLLTSGSAINTAAGFKL